jgi:hypothetical protein
MAPYLIQIPDEHEIRDAAFQLGSDKAPGPDGFAAQFVQQN